MKSCSSSSKKRTPPRRFEEIAANAITLGSKSPAMGFFRRIEDFFQRPPANTITFDEAEKALRLKKLQEELGAFTFSEEGFTYQTLTIRWADITRILSYKRDLGTVDLVCLQLSWPGGDLLFDEEMPGWYQFVDHLNAALPVLEKWEEKVMFPAFATNETVVYQK